MEGREEADVEEIAATGEYRGRLVHSAILVRYKLPASMRGKLTLQNIRQQHALKQ